MRLIFILIFFTLFSFANEIKNVTLQLPWKYQFQFAGYIMAKEKGYYKDVNLNVELKEIDFELAPRKAVLAKKSRFCNCKLTSIT